MTIKPAVENIFDQIDWLLGKVTNDEYSRIISNLNGSSIGQHVRHTLEFFKCLFEGVKNGQINYDERARNVFLENNTLEAKSLIEKLRVALENLPHDMPLILSQRFDSYGDNFQVDSNLVRELVYNVEHAVHHLALIRVGLHETKPSLELDESFGLASSTLRYRQLLEGLKANA